MSYDFDGDIPREGTHCVKYDLREAYFGRGDVIPMWVADMDFAVPPFVSEAILQRAGHPVFGYSVIPDSYYEAIIGWQKRRYGWEIKKDWILFSTGIVTGLNVIVQALTEPGDKIIVQSPVYFPFYSCVENNGRVLLVNQLVEEDGKYVMDLVDLEKKMKSGAKMLILCSPHNPVSRCWRQEELEWLGRKCLEYKVLLISDEIHCDLVFEPRRHVAVASLAKEFSMNTITCIAPSKTFNLAGLYSSSIIIENDSLRRKFKIASEKIHLTANIFGITAAEAAYRQGDAWLAELMIYLKSNADLVTGFLAEKLPEIKVSPVEATYMLWLDFRRLGLSPAEVKTRLIENAGLGLIDGTVFGQGGEGFQRMNIGCTKRTLTQALARLASAFRP